MKIDLSFVSQDVRKRMEEQQGAQHLMPGPLSIVEYEDALIVPAGCHAVGGLYDKQQKFVPLSWLSADRNWGGYVYDGGVALSDETVYFLGTLFPTWGHCLTDFLSRVWPLIGELKGRKDLSVVYVTTTCGEEMPDNFFALLAAVGIERGRIRRITEPTRFARVYFADRSFWHAHDHSLDEIRRYTDDYVRTVNLIRDHLAPKACTPTRTVYLSRGGWKKGRADFGEELVEKAFAERLGCEIVRPETFSLQGLVDLLYQSKTVIATDGSIAHNAILGPDCAKWIIVRKSDFVNFHQPVINEIRNLDVVYVDAYGRSVFKRKSRWSGPFFMYVSKPLAGFLRCKAHFPFWTYCHFETYVLSQRLRQMASKVKWGIIRFAGKKG